MGSASSSPATESVEQWRSTFSSCARPELAAAARPHYEGLGRWLSRGQLPIVYSPSYNIKFFGVERLHPFDASKFEKVVKQLISSKLVAAKQLVQPKEASNDVLQQVHSERYLTKLHGSRQFVAEVVELPLVAMFPMSAIQHYLLRPMRYQVAGTMLAAALALESGWSINVGGGMHHAYWDGGGGWCAYADITLAVRHLREATGGALQRVMVVDLDVHQGNGVARDKLHFRDDDLFILDAYNAQVYPGDARAKAGIDAAVELASGAGAEEYLGRLLAQLRDAVRRARPQLVVYNAGTDVLEGDPLGRLNVSAEGVLQRDEAVFAAAAEAQVPICMLLSGGYTRASAGLIANSIANLMRKFQLVRPPCE